MEQCHRSAWACSVAGSHNIVMGFCTMYLFFTSEGVKRLQLLCKSPLMLQMPLVGRDPVTRELCYVRKMAIEGQIGAFLRWKAPKLA